MKNILLSFLMPLLPKRLLSRFIGRLAKLKRPRSLVLAVMRAFAKYYRINLEEAEKSLEGYASLDAFFTRRLKQSARPIQSSRIHPVDGVMSASSEIRSQTLLQAKGWTYTLPKLLGETENECARFEGGRFFTYYLCPTDYHRVHMPFDGEVLQLRQMVGQLWPVNEWSVHRVRDLFCLNERLVFDIRTLQGQARLVMVGATNVGEMEVCFDPGVATNQAFQDRSLGERIEKTFAPAVSLKAGDDLGVFHLGSTVILVLEAPLTAGIPEFSLPHTVRLGQPL